MCPSTELGQLIDALVLRRGLELISHGLRPPADVVNIPSGVVNLLLASPHKIHEATVSCDRQIEQAESELAAKLSALVHSRRSNWDHIDRDAAVVCNASKGPEIVQEARQEALDRYWRQRALVARLPLEKFVAAAEEWLDKKVRVECLAALLQGSTATAPSDLPGDILIELAKPGGARRLHFDACNELNESEAEFVAATQRLAEASPYALAVCDQWVQRLCQDSAKTMGSIQLAELYARIRRQPVSRPGHPLLWPFATGGRCTRLQYWLSGVAWWLVVSGVFMTLKVKAVAADRAKWDAIFNGTFTPGTQKESNGLLLAVALIVMILYLWSSVTIDIRRVRDLGKSPASWSGIIALVAFLRACMCVPPAVIGCAAILSYSPFVIWCAFFPSRQPRV